MMLYEKNNDLSTNLSFTYDFGESFEGLDCRSIALNENETYLLLVGNSEVRFINFEATIASITNRIDSDDTVIVPCSSNIQSVPIHDAFNVNRPIAQWNYQNNNQYALVIDRLIRFYSVDNGRINETHAMIDTHHQRPISTISYWPSNPCCFLTGSLDGQVQVWDTRHLSSHMPANLKMTLTTPFSIRHLQWPHITSDKIGFFNDSYQLAVQCDRCIRIYDMRRTDSYLCSIEHEQRIISMDWTMQTRSIVTLSIDGSISIFSTDGHLLAESIPNEQLPFAINKIRATFNDNLFICSARDTISSTCGFIGWRWDEDNCLRPLTDQLQSISSSTIFDFKSVRDSRFLNLFQQLYPSRRNDNLRHFPILTWCRDNKLHLIDMDTTFRQIWTENITKNKRSLSEETHSTITNKSTNSSLSRRLNLNRTCKSNVIMDIIEDESSNDEQSDFDDNSSFGICSSRTNSSTDSPKTGNEHDVSINSDNIVSSTTKISIENEFNALRDTYGQYITVEVKDEQRRMCIIGCVFPSDKTYSFRIYLFLSRHYPIVSQLFVRFKLLFMNNNNDNHLKYFHMRIQALLHDTSNKCFYHGQLCLNTCLIKLKCLFDTYAKEEPLSSTLINRLGQICHEESNNNKNLDSPIINTNNVENYDDDTSNNHYSMNNNYNSEYNNSSRIADQSSLFVNTNDSPLSNNFTIRANPRTCAARFTGGTQLICFGRIKIVRQSSSSSPPPPPQQQQQQQQQQSVPVPSTFNNTNDSLNIRPAHLHMRSTSLTVSKSRGNSSTDEQSSSYRAPTAVANNCQIQNVPTNQRTTIFSAPVRTSLSSNLNVDHQRTSTSFRRSLSHHLPQSNSAVSIYDVSILLPINYKLAKDYHLDLKDLISMCQKNQQITDQMAKTELSYCWSLLSGLLTLQSNLSNDHHWFQTPIAQGLVKHLVSHYTASGDVQSATMFLLTMLETPYMAKNTINEHLYDPILYAYANLLHRWKYFYKRTQIIQKIDHNCQLSASTHQTSSTIICSICLQPVIGQQFLCAICSHGGHLVHIHEWFSSPEIKHRYCPEKDCTCRCIIKQQELLALNLDQAQKHQNTPTLTPKAYTFRSSSHNIRHF